MRKLNLLSGYHLKSILFSAESVAMCLCLVCLAILGIDPILTWVRSNQLSIHSLEVFVILTSDPGMNILFCLGIFLLLSTAPFDQPISMMILMRSGHKKVWYISQILSIFTAILGYLMLFLLIIMIWSGSNASYDSDWSRAMRLLSKGVLMNNDRGVAVSYEMIRRIPFATGCFHALVLIFLYVFTMVTCMYIINLHTKSHSGFAIILGLHGSFAAVLAMGMRPLYRYTLLIHGSMHTHNFGTSPDLPYLRDSYILFGVLLAFEVLIAYMLCKRRDFVL